MAAEEFLQKAVSVKNAARALGIGHVLVYELISSGQLASFKCNRRRLVSLEAINAFIRAREIENASQGSAR